MGHRYSRPSTDLPPPRRPLKVLLETGSCGHFSFLPGLQRCRDERYYVSRLQRLSCWKLRGTRGGEEHLSTRRASSGPEPPSGGVVGVGGQAEGGSYGPLAQPQTSATPESCWRSEPASLRQWSAGGEGNMMKRKCDLTSWSV